MKTIRWAGLICIVVGLALMLVFFELPGAGGLLVVIGGALLALSWRRAVLPAFQLGKPVPLRLSRWRWLAILGGLAVGAWLSYRLVDVLTPPAYFEQISLWLLSMGLFGFGASSRPRLKLEGRDDRYIAAALVLLTLFALVVRVINLEYGVPVLYVDEAPFGARARQIAEGSLQTVVFGPGHYSHPALFEVMIAPFVAIMGPARSAVRLVPAVLGALTVPALYWLGTALFSRRAGLIAAAFLAAYPVHIHFSRFALNNVIDPLFGVLAFAALAQGLRGRSSKPGWFALSGLMLGLSQFFYVGARILPLLMVLFVALSFVGKARVRAYLSRLAFVLSGFVLATLPTNVYLLANDLPLTWRIWASFDRSAFLYGDFWDVVQQKIVPSVLAYVHTPDGFYFYGGYTPVLLFIPAAAFLVGLAWLMLHWMRARGALLLSWLLVPTLGSMFLREVPGYARLVIVTPALALVVALGVERIVWYMVPRLRAQGFRVVVVLMAVIGAVNVVYYFGVHLEAFAETANDDPDMGRWLQQVGEAARTLPEDTTAVFLTEPEMKQYAYWIYNYHNGADEVWWANPYPVDVIDEMERSGRRYVIFFSEQFWSMLSELIRIHPDADLRWLPGTPEGAKALILFYRVP